VTLEDLGSPERLISGFAPEVIGSPLPDDGVTSTEVVQKDGRTYYQHTLRTRLQGEWIGRLITSTRGVSGEPDATAPLTRVP